MPPLTDLSKFLALHLHLCSDACLRDHHHLKGEQQDLHLCPGWPFQSSAARNFGVFVHPGSVPLQTSLPHSFLLVADTSRLRSTIFCPLNPAGWDHAGPGLRAKADDSFQHRGYGLELTIGFIKSAITSYGILETGEFILAALNSVVIGR